MATSRSPQQGDVYWIDPNPTSGREMKNRHHFVVITAEAINSLGTSMTVPITTAGAFAQRMGLTVPVSGRNTIGVAVCNQVRSFDLQTRVQMGGARYVESLDQEIVSEIISRVLSVIEPAE
ncbi:MAG: type II toxin-antitoxin system PemK/MazF family toxin [Myxococcaceae bacterium]